MCHAPAALGDRTVVDGPVVPFNIPPCVDVEVTFDHRIVHIGRHIQGIRPLIRVCVAVRVVLGHPALFPGGNALLIEERVGKIPYLGSIGVRAQDVPIRERLFVI